MKFDVLGFLFVLALCSIGDAYFKSYPFLFVVFIVAYVFLHGVLSGEVFVPASVFLFVCVFVSLLHFGVAFDYVSFLKLILNMVFFIFLSSYLARIDAYKAVKLFKIAAFIFISFSFFQAIYLVQSRDLWMLPFQLETSSDSYAFGGVVFGDANKNIWASKVAIFMVISIVCQYFVRRGFVYFISSMVMGGVVLFYVSSRTAQLAFIVFILVLAFYHFWLVKRQRAVLLVFAILALPFVFLVLSKLIRLDFADIASFDPELDGHMGDGFLARLIIWNYVIGIFDFKGLAVGNGILSFPLYTGGIFSENNPHNSFLNILMDFGGVALFLYVFMIWRVSAGGSLSRLLLIPLLVFLNSQYFGYDSEVMVFLAFIFFVGLSSRVGVFWRNNRSVWLGNIG